MIVTVKRGDHYYLCGNIEKAVEIYELCKNLYI